MVALRGLRRRVVRAVGVLWLVVGVVCLSGVSVASGEGCPNAGARGGLSGGLPECRAYEQVSPVFKNGFGLGYEHLLGDGERLLAQSVGVFAGAIPSECPFTLYDVVRSGGGWQTTAINDVPLTELVYATRHCTPQLLNEAGVSLLQLHPLSGSVYERDLYLHEANGAFVPVGPMLPPSAIPPAPTGSGEQGGNAGSDFVGGTPDFSHVLFELEALDTNLPPGVSSELWPGDTTLLGEESTGRTSLYEYAGDGNTTPALVGLDDSGHLISDCGTVPGGYGNPGNHLNVMSEDGSRVFFTAIGAGVPANPSCAGAPVLPAVDELFARVDGSQTVAISEPKALSPAGVDEGCTTSECQKNITETTGFRDANFEKASRDGSKVFFSSPQQLLDGASQDTNEEDSAVPQPGATPKGCTVTKGEGGCNLYEYDFNENPVTKKPVGLVLVSGGDSSGLGPEVQGVAAVSEDGSHVYFVAKGILTSEPREGASGKCIAELAPAELAAEEATKEGKCRPKQGAEAENLYVKDTLTGRTSFIATLAPTDAAQWEYNAAGTPMNVTDDGRFLAFTTTEHLTAGDTATVTQVFRYEATTEALTRISTGDQGHNGIGASEIATNRSETSVALDLDAHPGISEDGASVVFKSSEALAPGAYSNKCASEESGVCTAYIPNVYEYHEGHVYLIAHSGAGKAAAVISPSGQDIFFNTPESLVPQDTDTLNDIYDARIDGGFPPPPPTIPCSGDGCQTITSTPTFGAPASSTFTAPETTPPPPPAPVVPHSKPLTRAQKLTKALRACKKKPKKQRKTCETQAKHHYHTHK